MTSPVEHHFLPVNGIRMHVVTQGKGPLVLLCHGWPELWYSWRHQMAALADAGFRVAAPDMRGYGETESPHEIGAYSAFHLSGDVVGLVAALGEKTAILVGHDWGATVAWTTALLRPDVFPAVAALSVPYRGRGPGEPLAMLRKSGYEDYYWIYFQEPGVAEAEFEQDVPATMRKILVGLSGEAPEGSVSIGRIPAGGGFLTNRSAPETLPAWLKEEDLAVFVAAFQRTGFRGGLNWYRNLSLNWELQAPWQGARIQQPAMFIAGTKDGVLAGKRGIAALENMKVAVPHVEIHLIEGAGHWIQQERAAEVSERLVAFARAHT